MASGLPKQVFIPTPTALRVVAVREHLDRALSMALPTYADLVRYILLVGLEELEGTQHWVDGGPSEE